MVQKQYGQPNILSIQDAVCHIEQRSVSWRVVYGLLESAKIFIASGRFCLCKIVTVTSIIFIFDNHMQEQRGDGEVGEEVKVFTDV